MTNWSNVRVRLSDTWGPGAGHSLNTPVQGQMPDFCLRPRYLRDAQGDLQLAHFTVDFPSGYLSDGWQGVNFIPMGSTPVAGISSLPAWDPAHRDTYRNMINAAAGNLGDSKTTRLEAVIPYLGSSGGVGYNKIRLFYVPNAVGGKVMDLVVVKVLTHAASPGTVQGRQDGSGHGPPG